MIEAIGSCVDKVPQHVQLVARVFPTNFKDFPEAFRCVDDGKE